MFLVSPFELTILILGLFVLSVLSYKRIDLALGIIILALPLYLIRLKIWFVPTTVLELMIYVVFGIWMIKKIKSMPRIIRAKRGLVWGQKHALEIHQKSKIKNREISFFVILNLFQNLLLISKKKFIRSRNKFGMTIPIFLILLGCIISIIVSPNKQTGLGILKGWFVDPLLLFLIIVDVIKTPSLILPLTKGEIEGVILPFTKGEIGGVILLFTKREMEGVIKILSFLTVSGIIVAIIGLCYYFFGELTYDGRLKAFFLSPNHLAMYLAPSGIIAFGLFLNFDIFIKIKKLQIQNHKSQINYNNQNTKSKTVFNFGHLDFLKLNKIFSKIQQFIKIQKNWFGYFWLFAFIICSIVIFLTYSYGAWLGFAAGILFLVLFSFNVIAKTNYEKQLSDENNGIVSLCYHFVHNNSKKKILFLIIVGLFLSIIFFSQYNTEKFQNLTNFSRSSFESRIMIWKASLAILKDHPFLGIGPGNFQDFYLDYQKKFPPYLEWAVPQPHNLFLAFYLQCGLLGLIGFLWLILLFFKKGFRQLPIAVLTAVMIYILIHGLIDTPYWKNDLAVIFWIIVGLMTTIKNSPPKAEKFKITD